jgi:hypothetical protein
VLLRKFNRCLVADQLGHNPYSFGGVDAMTYVVLKFLHILGATVILGTAPASRSSR